MSPGISFHPRVQKDLNEILDFFEQEGGTNIAARFEDEFRASVELVRQNPRHFPFYWTQRLFRRCKLKTFPHLILFRECRAGVRILVLKHVKRAPSFGLGRR